jgi:hypothetical protein
MERIRGGIDGARGQRTEGAVRGGNCGVTWFVVRVTGTAGRCCEGSSCPTGGSVSFKGNRP